MKKSLLFSAMAAIAAHHANQTVKADPMTPTAPTTALADLSETDILDMARAAHLSTSRISTIIEFARNVARRAAQPVAPVQDVLTIPTAIMNLLPAYQAEPGDDYATGYATGHRDARHAAADLVLARADELKALAQSPQIAEVAELPQHLVIEMLLEVARLAFDAMDGTEENEQGLLWDRSNFDALSKAMDKLEALPDDQPGFVMEPAAKARWALRNAIAASRRAAGGEAAMRAALTPLAAIADLYSDREDDHFQIWKDMHVDETRITLGQCRAARAALATPAPASAGQAGQPKAGCAGMVFEGGPYCVGPCADCDYARQLGQYAAPTERAAAPAEQPSAQKGGNDE